MAEFILKKLFEPIGNDDNPDAPFADPIKQIITKNASEHAAKQSSAKATEAEVLKKVFGPDAVAPVFAKGTVGARLGITRTEEKIINNEKWIYAYRGDELAEARLAQ